MEIIVVASIAIAFGAARYFSQSQRVKRQLKRVPRLALAELPEGRRARVVGAAQVLDNSLDALADDQLGAVSAAHLG